MSRAVRAVLVFVMFFLIGGCLGWAFGQTDDQAYQVIGLMVFGVFFALGLGCAYLELKSR